MPYPLAACRGKSALPPGSSLLGNLAYFLKLGEASGSRADSSGNGNTFTANNAPGSETGVVGDALALVAGSSQSLSRADNASVSLGADQAVTGSVWVKLASKGADRTILFKGSAVSAAGAEYLLWFANASDRFEFYLGNGTSGTLVTASALGSPALDTWYHLVFWHDPVANTLNIQVNGGTINSAAWTGGTQDTSGAATVGAAAGARFWDGAIDALGLWKRVLTLAERAVLYNAGAGREHPFA